MEPEKKIRGVRPPRMIVDEVADFEQPSEPPAKTLAEHGLVHSDFEPHIEYGFLVAVCYCGWRYKHRRRKVVQRAWDKHLDRYLGAVESRA